MLFHRMICTDKHTVILHYDCTTKFAAFEKRNLEEITWQSLCGQTIFWTSVSCKTVGSTGIEAHLVQYLILKRLRITITATT